MTDAGSIRITMSDEDLDTLLETWGNSEGTLARAAAIDQAIRDAAYG